MPRRSAQPIRTAWHPLFIRALRRGLPARYFRIEPELHLSEEPLRLDAAVVRRRRLPPSYRPAAFGGLYELLGDHTLIELTGTTSALGWSSLVRLLIVGGLYCIDKDIRDPGRVRLVAVAPTLTGPFRDQARRRSCALRRLGPGTWEIEGLHHRAFVIETETVSDHALHLFSRTFLRAPTSLVPLLSGEEYAILRDIFDEVKQFKQDPRAMLRYPDYEEVTMSLDQLLEEILPNLTPEQRLRGLRPEEICGGLSVRERERLLRVLEADRRPVRRRPATSPGGRRGR